MKHLLIKPVDAVFMTLGDYNTHRGWTIPEGQDPNEPGYLITSNEGRETWQPKDEFDMYCRRVHGPIPSAFGQGAETIEVDLTDDHPIRILPHLIEQWGDDADIAVDSPTVSCNYPIEDAREIANNILAACDACECAMLRNKEKSE